MNLIGHYACAAHAPAVGRVGAVLPDLLSLYNRKVRPRALEAAAQSEARELAQRRPAVGAARVQGVGVQGTGVQGPGVQGPGVPMTPRQMLLRGMAHHHAVDATFHRHPLFVEGNGALSQALRAAGGAPGLKRFLPAHVLLEMFLDHLLLAAHPTLGARLTADLHAHRDEMCALAVLHPQADAASFATFLERVLQDRYWEDYRTADGMMARMDRILLRFGQRVLEAGEQRAVEGVFEARREGTAAVLAAFVALEQARSPWPPAAPPELTPRSGRLGRLETAPQPV